jgi:non-homologous end joining protein Ku
MLFCFLSHHIYSDRSPGERLLVDTPFGTRETIEAGEKARGVEVGKNQYLLIEHDELDGMTIESNHTIESRKSLHRGR